MFLISVDLVDDAVLVEIGIGPVPPAITLCAIVPVYVRPPISWMSRVEDGIVMDR